MSLWVCVEHGLYGGDVLCPSCGKAGSYTDLGTASVDTHAERCDVKQAQPARVASAVAATSGETPNGGTNG